MPQFRVFDPELDASTSHVRTRAREVGRIASLNVSAGGVPKLRCVRRGSGQRASRGTRQRNKRIHGGPMRALCLYSLERIAALRRKDIRSRRVPRARTSRSRGSSWTLVVPGAATRARRRGDRDHGIHGAVPRHPALVRPRDCRGASRRMRIPDGAACTRACSWKGRCAWATTRAFCTRHPPRHDRINVRYERAAVLSGVPPEADRDVRDDPVHVSDLLVLQELAADGAPDGRRRLAILARDRCADHGARALRARAHGCTVALRRRDVELDGPRRDLLRDSRSSASSTIRGGCSRWRSVFALLPVHATMEAREREGRTERLRGTTATPSMDVVVIIVGLALTAVGIYVTRELSIFVRATGRSAVSRRLGVAGAIAVRARARLVCARASRRRRHRLSRRPRVHRRLHAAQCDRGRGDAASALSTWATPPASTRSLDRRRKVVELRRPHAPPRLPRLARASGDHRASPERVRAR